MNHTDPPDEPVVCGACGEVCHEENQISCSGCGFSWSEIAAAEHLVDVVGEALGVDTYTCSESAFRAALIAVLNITSRTTGPVSLPPTGE
jgi:hypothetical protein